MFTSIYVCSSQKNLREILVAVLLFQVKENMICRMRTETVFQPALIVESVKLLQCE